MKVIDKKTKTYNDYLNVLESFENINFPEGTNYLFSTQKGIDEQISLLPTSKGIVYYYDENERMNKLFVITFEGVK